MLTPELEQTYSILKRIGPCLARIAARYTDLTGKQVAYRIKKLEALGYARRVGSENDIAIWDAVRNTEVSERYYKGLSEAAHTLYVHFTDVERDELLADMNQKDAERWRKIAERLNPNGNGHGNGRPE